VKLAIGAGRGGGISGISTGGGGFRSLTACGAAGLRRAFAAPPAGFARLAFALRALPAFAFPALRAF